MNTKNPAEVFKKFRLPIDYGNTREQEPPFLVYTGQGAKTLKGDNQVYFNTYDYRVEYYFRAKDERLERELEDFFTKNGIVWYKSNDVFIRDDDMFVIYYDI